MTKEERFILKLYELALSYGDIKTPVKSSILAKELRLSEKVIYHIIRDLTKINFLIKINHGERIALTDNGINLVQRLKS